MEERPDSEEVQARPSLTLRHHLPLCGWPRGPMCKRLMAEGCWQLGGTPYAPSPGTLLLWALLLPLPRESCNQAPSPSS